MNTLRFMYTIFLSATVPCAIILIAYASRRQTMPGARYFIFVMIAAISYNITYIGEINSNQFSTALIWFHIEHLPISILHYLWLIMSLEYARIEDKHLRILKRVMLYHPILYSIIYFTNNLHHLYIIEFQFINNGYFPVIVTTKGPFYMLSIISGTLISLIAMSYYIRGYVKTIKLQRYSYIIMIIASILPWFTVYLNIIDVGKLGIDYFPVVLIISGVLYSFGILRFRIFNTIPIATETVFRLSKEGILLIDRMGQIIDVNTTFLNMYPELLGRSRKLTITSFINSHPEFKELLGHDKKIQFHFGGTEDERYYSAEIIDIISENLLIGKILTVSEITLYMKYQKELENIAHQALHTAETNEISFLQAQIKPHFLNNTLSVIASMISRDPLAAKNLITYLGEYLTNCYYFDSSSPMVSLESELETVKTFVIIQKARFGERLSYDLICGDIPQISIPRLVLQPLIENAILHGILKKAEGGKVWLSINRDDRKVYFEIKDDGVGMREEIYNKLLSSVGEGQGIGFWNIHKRLIKLYGEGLTIRSTVGEGTCVSFHITC